MCISICNQCWVTLNFSILFLIQQIFFKFHIASSNVQYKRNKLKTNKVVFILMKLTG